MHLNIFKEVDSITFKNHLYVFTFLRIVYVQKSYDCSTFIHVHNTRAHLSLTPFVCIIHFVVAIFRCLFIAYSFSLPIHWSPAVWRVYLLLPHSITVSSTSLWHIYFVAIYRCLCKCSSACKSCTFHIHSIQNDFAR